jgi:hypothetical protein
MECHEARMLLAFTRPHSDAMDAAERAEVHQHLESCPECAAMALSEQTVDGAFGKAMREVAIPSGLQQRVLTKVAANRPYPWPAIAAAAAILLVVAGAGTWWFWPQPRFDSVAADDVFNGKVGNSPDDVEKWYQSKGVDMAAWRQLNHDYLWSYDIIEFKGRRVAKLLFYRQDNRSIAQVIVLPRNRFNTSELYDGYPGQTPNRVVVQRDAHADYIFLVGSTDLDSFLLPSQ